MRFFHHTLSLIALASFGCRDELHPRGSKSGGYCSGEFFSRAEFSESVQSTDSFQLSAHSYVTVRVYDVVGREVATLVSEDKPPGSYTIQWDASKLCSGVYFDTFRAGNFVERKKMVLAK